MSTAPFTPAGTTPPPDLDNYFARALIKLQKEYVQNETQPTARAAATMAVLRKADPGKVDTSPSTWSVLYSAFPEDFFGNRDEITARERAAHAALVLYAVHQTSQPKPLHQSGIRLGQALRRLSVSQDEKNPVPPRLTSLIAASTFDATMYHLRGLMSLLRREGIPLDHISLYRDLVRLQNPRNASRVRRQWGRDYFASPAQETDNSSIDIAATSTAITPQTHA
ncbi:hypothetical protein KEM60_00902 [Austwickia sp. TVS 96-490-7B]|uniref:type I-E CRISPR-associated protein Cse2/CasB n=1 Tax=Austwickia sp. TVS 96-490-7B TaxID=2830843 RepID=UPI001C57AC24|nr:type I-E CRISPR-associated protein Cse2/CasB [Austwickia sp. TVS 96-490-7B]MBW3084713.1 hypothetical protein [Austwickia sp. TVS 96-490-7B]